MTTFMHWWVIVITLVNIFACYWLIKWTMKKRPEESEVGSVTGHVWDGLEECDNPPPRWWLRSPARCSGPGRRARRGRRRSG